MSRIASTGGPGLVITHGSELVLVPEKAVVGGRMLARDNGRIVLVRGALPGERVRVRIERVARGVAYAVAIEILEAHADRRDPEVDPTCGGNAFAHVVYSRQLALKADIIADALARQAHVVLPDPVSIEASPERGYRVRARFHLSAHRAGFYREGTHEICDAATSGQLGPGSVETVDAVVKRVVDAGADPAVITGIELAENVAGTERALHLELCRSLPAGTLEALDLPGGLTGLSWSSAATPRTHVVSGTPYVVDELDGLASGVVRLRRHVRAFFQANRYLVTALAARVLSLVPAGPVVDLYAGVGLFAAAIATGRQGRGGEVTAVEGDATSAADLAANAATCAVRFSTRHLPVEEFLAGAVGIDAGTMVVDPPRTGLSRAAVQGLRRHRPHRIVYVSCDIATFARDVKTLAAEYALTHLEAFDLFPNTAHVETVAMLERRTGPAR